jgi:hypothetical protein
MKIGMNPLWKPVKHIDHYAWVTLKTSLPVKRIENKFLK